MFLLLLACTGPTETELPATVPLSCTPGSAAVPADVVGLSDPHTVDPGVFALIDEARAPWVRAELHWSVIQPDPDGPMDFSAYDTMIDDFRARGIEVQAILTYIPPAYGNDWDRIDADFRTFATEAVRRYAPRGVHAWEVFNEPNLTGYGWLTEDDGAFVNLPNYTRLLGIANEVVRAEDPDGIVILGGIASEQHRGLDLEQTMDVLYGYGAADCFDVFAFHPYGYQNDFATARERVQDVLEGWEVPETPVWFNEYGWTDQDAMDLAVNPTAETNPMLAAFAQSEVADGFFWFSAKDYSSRAGTPTFGLADFDLNRRPSFTTFQSVMDAR